jgi:hypothetical protein
MHKRKNYIKKIRMIERKTTVEKNFTTSHGTSPNESMIIETNNLNG